MIDYKAKSFPFKIFQPRSAFCHWYLIAFLLIFFGIFSLLNTIKRIYLIISILVLVLGLILIFTLELRRGFNYLLVEKNKIDFFKGIFSSHEISIYYNQITDFQIKKNLIGKLFNSGEIHINTAGSQQKEIVFSLTPNPESLRNLIESQRNKSMLRNL